MTGYTKESFEPKQTEPQFRDTYAPYRSSFFLEDFNSSYKLKRMESTEDKFNQKISNWVHTPFHNDRYTRMDFVYYSTIQYVHVYPEDSKELLHQAVAVKFRAKIIKALLRQLAIASWLAVWLTSGLATRCEQIKLTYPQTLPIFNPILVNLLPTHRNRHANMQLLRLLDYVRMWFRIRIHIYFIV